MTGMARPNSASDYFRQTLITASCGKFNLFEPTTVPRICHHQCFTLVEYDMNLFVVGYHKGRLLEAWGRKTHPWIV